MPTAGRMRRRLNKFNMGRLKEGGSMVSDVERQQMEQGLQQGATAALGAQQAQMGQLARTQTSGGAFQEQPFLESQSARAKQSGDVAVKASGQQRLMEAQLSDQRKGAIMAENAALHDINRQNAAGAFEAFQWFVEMPSDALGNVLGAGKNFVGP